ncbi:tetratricopeptide repeat protein, partial [Flavobacterium sp.]|uniref:tetratricopeptide repeat protein n=1 Tax=Flavobacterium sp. TaxID=239 RepID=UPI00374CA7B2
MESFKDSIYNNFDQNPQKAKLYSHKFLKIARKLNDNKEESNAYYLLAELCGTISQKDSAIFYFKKAIDKASAINNQELVLNYKINKASYLFTEYDFNGALLLYDECLKLAKKNGNKKAYDYITNKRGNVYYEIGKYNEALAIFKKSLRNKDFEALTLLGIQLSITKTFLKLNQPDSALVYSKKSISEAKNLKLEEFEMHFYHEEGLIYTYKKKYEIAEKSFDKALFLAQKDDFFEMKRLILISKSKLFSLQKQSDKAILLLKEIVSNKNNIPISVENRVVIDSLLADNYKAMNKLALSNFHYQKCNEGQRKLNSKKIDAIDQLHKIDLLEVKDESDNQTKLKWIFTLIAILSVIGLIIIYIKKIKS